MPHPTDTSPRSTDSSRALRCPPAGATIAIVAPAGPAKDEQVQQIPALLERFGYRARLYPGCEARGGYLAGSDRRRADEFVAALCDPSIAALWCLRGGYGSARLLEHIEPALIRTHVKPLIGYSDITALHALYEREGCLALHAPMPASDLVRPGREADADALMSWLRSGLRAGTCLAPPLAAAAPRTGGIARGRLAGGNLSVLASLVGTPWQPHTEGRILFLEEIGEDLYRVDRLLLQLRLAGLLDAAAGFLLGSFNDMDDPGPLLAETLSPLGKPVLGGWPAGHGTPNRPLPIGARVTLDADAGTLTIDEDVLIA